ncbi:MAG: type I restriction endonuclease subunit R [Alkalispirochaeta sp.]
MSDLHTEKYFEDDVVAHLTSHGWLGGDPARYVAERALYPEDALWWVQYAYPTEWEKFVLQNPGDPDGAFLDRLTQALDKRGTLAVLRHGFKIAGLGSTRLAMMTSRPASGNNPEAVERYEAIRCRVVRQVHYSPHRPAESIDLVLFVNGLPVATMELKTQFTQSVHDAIRQYRFDRPPTDPTTRSREPLLQFRSRAIVHFAVSTEEVYMATRLAGAHTRFLPFNRGYLEGAGNPPNPDGYKTAYLWERVLQRDAWLHIVAKFVHLEERDAGKQTLIFPRFHQWDAVTQLVADVRSHAGEAVRRLIQHSAGSGKSNSIGWLAHHLSSLWISDEKKLFDSVIVVTDRTVLDSQLQDTIYQFDHKQGVVERITTEGGAKSTQLAQALAQRKPIIIVTIQTFGKVLEKLGSQEMQDHTFAVIADEAHTSQTGKAAASLKQALGFTVKDEDEEISLEDVLTEAANSRYGAGNISYFAFTATPKAKTMQLFGSQQPDGSYLPFHSYPMRQAIEEGFILDVLTGYIPYKVAYKLAHQGRDYDDEEVDKSEASKALSRWVRLHPYNIAQKVQIIVEHFREHVAGRLNGEAKAMVVTGSRKEAVRYKLAMDRYIYRQHYRYGTLVAFSGEVHDPESSVFPLTEKNMNPGLGGEDLRTVFDHDAYQVMIVANKYQTGFDQPKLVAMYLDKRLAGVATVQTLSRLNRTYPGKDWTAVLDFVNDPEQVLADFQQYYRGATLPTGADPQMVIDLQEKLDAQGIYYESEVDAFAEAYYTAVGAGRELTQRQLSARMAPVLQRFTDRLSAARLARDETGVDALKLFVKDMESFCSLYDFLSQIVPLGDADLEKRYILFKHLAHPLREALLTGIANDGGIDLSRITLTHYAIHRRGGADTEGLAMDPNGMSVLEAPTGQGTGEARSREEVLLSELVAQLNKIFEGDLSDADMVNYAEATRDKVMEDSEVVIQAQNNESLDQFANGKIRDAVPSAIIQMMEANAEMTQQVMASKETMARFVQVVTELVYGKARRESA